jgi:hypothetical protein
MGTDAVVDGADWKEAADNAANKITGFKKSS